MQVLCISTGFPYPTYRPCRSLNPNIHNFDFKLSAVRNENVWGAGELVRLLIPLLLTGNIATQVS